MNTPSRSKRRQRRFQKNNEVIVIDSDSDAEEEDNRKPAAKPSSAKNHPFCISLLESTDEENERRSPNLPSSKRNKRKLDRREAEDRELAERLQKEEKMAARKASSCGRRAEKEMTKSSDGKAVLAVQEIIALVTTAKQKFITSNPSLQRYCVEAVTIDDMVYFAKNMLDLQEEFMQKQINGYIDTGYHYTDQRNMANIRTHGLMTAAERQTSNVRAAPKGAVFGDGIYTANNGTHFRHFGDVGLIVGRLHGKAVRAAGFLDPRQTVDANTIIGDKRMSGIGMNNHQWPNDCKQHEYVLRSSKQCLPMIRFDQAIRNHKDGKECIRFIKRSLQQILDRLFNNGLQRVDVKNVPSFTPPQFSATAALAGMPPFIPPPNFGMPFNPAVSTAVINNMNRYLASAANRSIPPPSRSSMHPMMMPSMGTAARRTHSSATTQKLKYTAPQSLNTGVPSNAVTTPPASCNMRDECIICFDPLKKKTCVALSTCKHVFHKKCIQQAFKANPKCPVCRTSIGEPQGKSPSGEMKISNSPIQCSGFREDSIIISYNIPPAPQLSYHDNPGAIQAGKSAMAYLPNNSDGQNLCKRLNFAFMHGLTFTVGTSVTTGAPNQCTWASVHHKTSPFGGATAHGFPDPDYFANCNGELDALGVPPVQSLDDDGNAK
mmetsp:Transcript_14838/g.26967  ORF Transcript_14838/g.26967 Transcript_14838/m.26967 type:complete len:660 (+) Transcript_14838:184-2163(+)|eukprot:CAMPEP_0201929986 /NCGR_PEP_ID=MMETSP0903-20130614/24216_1 /ASSEMBLY_ACC=CAM_ASM_000552 /TAXON_ID=420261 /ORGANISM="Thalassiosira antarctica, Strain CCMP982" /LENGTH=659 /DNA_ID=CAMNT_0048468925 /DNA_START=124 /DNA_END=2103 /DNA_ORIENTATION=+